LHEFRQVALLGLIVGIVIEVMAIASLTNYFVNNAMFNYFIWGIGLVVVGLLFLVKFMTVFIPLKQQKFDSQVCPNCGAILKEDTSVCEKCKQQITDN
jgi:hypothetical protein